jgi:protocatechuate 3,4-dioxygenase alpha subunit
MASGQTPSQTVGPFFAYGLTPEQYGYNLTSVASPQVADESTEGTRIRIQGQVFDGEGAPVNDAMIEIWQADHEGRYAHPGDHQRPNSGFNGFGRTGTGTDTDLQFWFDTIKPGMINPEQAPHISVIVFMRGLPSHVYTRLYFSDEAARNAIDPVLQLVPKDRRSTLIARRLEGAGADGTGVDGSGPATYKFDIHMQGDQETVFFDV